MPTYQIKAPDGNTYRIDGPEGASDDQVREQVLKQHPNAGGTATSATPPAAPQSSGVGDFFKSIPRGAVEGFLSTGATEAQALEGSAGRDPSQIPSGAESTKIVEKNVTGKMHEPEGFPGRVGASVGSALGTPASYLAPGGLAAKTGLAVSSAVGGQVGAEVAGTPGRIVGGVIGGGAFAGARAVGQAATNPQGNALNFLQKAAERDGTTLEQLQQRLSEARKIRPDATIADVAGTNVRGQVERLGQVPGAPAAKLETRLTANQKQQLTSIGNDLTGLTGTDRSAFEAVESTMAQRAEQATPLYQQAYVEGDKEIFSPGLEQLSSAPAVRGAMQSAVTTWQNNAVADGFGAMNPTMVGQGGLIRFGNSIPAFPNLQFWDYTKRVLDNEISKAVRAGEDGKVRTLTRLVTMLRDELDKPEQGLTTYKAAREAWGGPSRYMDSIEEGRDILSKKVSAEELTARVAAMSESDKEGFRIGAISAIKGAMGNDPAKLADYTKYLRSPEVRAKIAAIMPTPEAAEKWLQSLDFEIGRSELTGLGLKGSPTARRQAQQADADSLIGDLVLSSLSGHPTSWGLIKTVFGKIPKAVSDKIRARSDDILVDILTTPEGAKQAVSQGAKQSAGRGTSALSAGALAPHQLPPIEVESP
jgi:hypothetical protein